MEDYKNLRGLFAMEIYNHGCEHDGLYGYNSQAYDEMLRAGQHIGCLMDAVRIYALGIIELDDILHAAPAQGV